MFHAALLHEPGQRATFLQDACGADDALHAELKAMLAAHDNAGDPGAERLRRFEQEAHASGALNHPNVLTLYDVGTADGRPYLVMELPEIEHVNLLGAAGYVTLAHRPDRLAGRSSGIGTIERR